MYADTQGGDHTGMHSHTDTSTATHIHSHTYIYTIIDTDTQNYFHAFLHTPLEFIDIYIEFQIDVYNHTYICHIAYMLI